MAAAFARRRLIAPGLTLLVWIWLVTWMASIPRIETNHVDASTRLEVTIRTNNYPGCVADRLRLLRDMPLGLTIEAAAGYLDLTEECLGGWGNANTSVSLWRIEDRFQVEITARLGPTDREDAERVVRVAVLQLQGSDPDTDKYVRLIPYWTTKGLQFE